MSSSFTFLDTFPVIAELIINHPDPDSFVTHSVLVEKLLASEQGGALINAAAATSSLDAQHVAITMIAWFSQQFTMGRNPYCNELERQRVDGRWAYRKSQRPAGETTEQSQPTSDFWSGATSGPLMPFEEIMAAWHDEFAEEDEAAGGQSTGMVQKTRDIVDAVMKRMHEKPHTPPDPFSDSRRSAFSSYYAGEDFFEIAKRYKISTRTLLAWLNHEGAKWENDMFEGRDPGPGADYSGEWPDLETELEMYAMRNIPPEKIEDLDLQARYRKHLAARNKRDA